MTLLKMKNNRFFYPLIVLLCGFTAIAQNGFSQRIKSGSLNEDVALAGEEIFFNADSTKMFGFETFWPDNSGNNSSLNEYDLQTLNLKTRRKFELPGTLQFSYTENNKVYYIGATEIRKKQFKLFTLAQDSGLNSAGCRIFDSISADYVMLRNHCFSEKNGLHYFVFYNEFALPGKKRLFAKVFDRDFNQKFEINIEVPGISKGLVPLDYILSTDGTTFYFLLASSKSIKDPLVNYRSTNEMYVCVYQEGNFTKSARVDLPDFRISGPTFLMHVNQNPFIAGINKSQKQDEILFIRFQEDFSAVKEINKINLGFKVHSLEKTFIGDAVSYEDSSLLFTFFSETMTPKVLARVEKNNSLRWAHVLPEIPGNGSLNYPYGSYDNDSIHFIYASDKTDLGKHRWIENGMNISNSKSVPGTGIMKVSISEKTGNAKAILFESPVKSDYLRGVSAVISLNEKNILARAVYFAGRKKYTQLILIPRQ